MNAEVLSGEGICVELDGRTVIDDATLGFEGGMLHAVVGRSGAGKSVLMKAMTGLLPLHRGFVEVNAGGIYRRLGPGDEEAFAFLRAQVVFVHQDPALLDDLDVLDNVLFGRIRRRSGTIIDDVNTWLNRLSLFELRHRRPRDLSPGAQRRVALCRALVLAPAVLVVDEPTTGLDPSAAEEVDHALLELARAGSTAIIVTHDLRSLERLRPNLTWIHEGRVGWRGPYGDRQGRAALPACASLVELLQERT
ncbi:MAG: ATP-binding cassette domain-containing protein [Myxococcota bacterium]